MPSPHLTTAPPSARQRRAYARGGGFPALPPSAAEMAAALQQVDDLELTPATLRWAFRMARLIDRDPDVAPAKVALFLGVFDRLFAERIRQLQERADSAVLRRLRARAAPVL